MPQIARQIKATVLAGFVVLGGLFSPAPTTAGSVEICRHPELSEAKEYWFWEIYFGVTVVSETGGELFWSPNRNFVSCYRLKKNELADSAKRVHGYKKAIEQWIGGLESLEEPDWRDRPEMRNRRELILRHLQKLTGETLLSSTEWRAWWRENNEYLGWSDSANRLVVDEEAKRDRTPINEEIVILSAEDYWLFFARGWLKEVREEEGFLRGWKEVVPPFAEEGERGKIRVSKAAVADRAAKQRAYLKAAEEAIPYPAARYSSVLEEIFMERLRQLSGENFTTAPQWVQWWEKNKNDLALSEDGERIVISPGKKEQMGGP